MIYTALLISFATLGFRCITGKNMIFYFLRKPFDYLASRKSVIIESVDADSLTIINLQQAIDANLKNFGEDHKKTEMYKDHLSQIHSAKSRITLYGSPIKYDWLLYLMKPIILCSTCMASVHTLIWYHYLTQVNPFLTWDTVIVMLMVAFLNTILFALIELIQKHAA